MLDVEIPERTASALKYLLSDKAANPELTPRDVFIMVSDAVETAFAVGRGMTDDKAELLSKTRSMSWLEPLSDAVVNDIQSAGILWGYQMTSFFDADLVVIIDDDEVRVPIVFVYLMEDTVVGIVKKAMDLAAVSGVDVAAAAVDAVVEKLPEMAVDTIDNLLHEDED